MRYSDRLLFSVCRPDQMVSWGNAEYLPAMQKVAEVLDVPLDQLTFAKDHQQYSTMEAGKSGCTGIIYNTSTMPEAIKVMQTLQRELPKVNFEVHINPDGALDQGDGPASYNLDSAKTIAIPESGFNCCIVIDAQNVLREMKFLGKAAGPEPSSRQR